MATPVDIRAALIAAVAADQRVLAITEGGAAVAGELDEFSDLDLVVVCRDTARTEVLREAPVLARRLGPLLASFPGDHVGEPRLIICLYDPPLLHVDLKFVGLADLAERIEDGVVVWQRDGLDAGALIAGEAGWPQPDRQWIEDRFWIWVHYCAAKIGRAALERTIGDHTRAGCIAALRATIELYRDLRGDGEVVQRAEAEAASAAYLDEIAS